ncbi:RNA polymerase sigma factor [soil metagenome]
MKLQIQKSLCEEKLIDACIKNKSAAQKELFERFSSKMFTICLRYIKDASEAEDVLITGFMKVFEKLNQFQFQGSFEGWIRKIIINEALGYIRQHKTLFLEVDIDRIDKGFLVPDSLEEEDLLVMIQNLPIGYRTIFNLYAIEGYSHKEIADLMGINENTSKSQLSRARTILKKMLLEHEKQTRSIVKV